MRYGLAARAALVTHFQFVPLMHQRFCQIAAGLSSAQGNHYQTRGASRYRVRSQYSA